MFENINNNRPYGELVKTSFENLLNFLRTESDILNF